MNSAKIVMVATAVTGILALSSEAQAGASCNEHVTSIIVHSNGNVYFMTDQTCSTSWCQVNWTTTDKAYAMLLTAQAQGKTIYFYWDTVSSCSSTNPVYASPAYFSIGP